MGDNKLNGSVDLLAKAMRRVAVEEGIIPVPQGRGGIKDGLKTTEAQLAQNRKDIDALKENSS